MEERSGHRGHRVHEKGPNRGQAGPRSGPGISSAQQGPGSCQVGSRGRVGDTGRGLAMRLCRAEGRHLAYLDLRGHLPSDSP